VLIGGWRDGLGALEGICASRNLPATTAVGMEPLEEPDEGINEQYPKEDFDPSLGKHAGQSVVGSYVNLVVSVLEGDLDVSGIEAGGNGRADGGFNLG
jgi:hypothetical protein